MCGCTAWLQCDFPNAPPSSEVELGGFCCCACACDLENCSVAESQPRLALSREKGLTSRVTQVQVLVSPREEAMLLRQPRETRCPPLCSSSEGTRETPCRAPRSPLHHLGTCHPPPPRGDLCTLHAVASWLRFCDNDVTCFLLGTTQPLPMFHPTP